RYLGKRDAWPHGSTCTASLAAGAASVVDGGILATPVVKCRSLRLYLRVTADVEAAGAEEIDAGDRPVRPPARCGDDPVTGPVAPKVPRSEPSKTVSRSLAGTLVFKAATTVSTTASFGMTDSSPGRGVRGRHPRSCQLVRPMGLPSQWRSVQATSDRWPT